MANLSIVNSASEPAVRSKKVKKTYSSRGKVHGPGNTNKERVEKEDQEEGVGDEDDEMEGEDDDMEGSGHDNEEEVEKSSGILGGGNQGANDTDRNRSSRELGQHRDEEPAMEETDTVAAAGKSEEDVEEEQGEALLMDGETLSTSAAATAGTTNAVNGICVGRSQATNISAEQQPSPSSLPQLKRKRGRPSGSTKKSTHSSSVCPLSPPSPYTPIQNSNSELKGQRTQKERRTSITDTSAAQQYIVQTILAVRMMRFNGGSPEKALLVHWKDFDDVKDLSWEPERILREDALEIVEQFYLDWIGEEE